MSVTEPATHRPIDAVSEKLNDPGVAASLVTLLDNAELLSTLVHGLGGFIERGDVIMDAVAESVNELKAASPYADGSTESLPSLNELKELVAQLTAAAPVLQQLLNSSLVQPEMIMLLSDVSEAATEGAANARTNQTTVAGVRDAFRSFKDPDVQRGLGMIVEIARSLGRQLG